MKKVMVLIISLMVMLTACSESEVTGKRVTAPTPTGNVVQNIQEVQQAQTETQTTETTAAEALEQIKEQGTLEEPTDTAGSSVYPPIVTSKQGKDALLERTKSAFSKSGYVSNVEADDKQGARYYDDGKLVNVPDGYGEETNYD